MNFEHLSPYDLGITGDPAAVPYLIRYLYQGNSNTRRLAASAIGKLSIAHRDVCAMAVLALLDCLMDPAPQTRQYVLKALTNLPLPPEAVPVLTQISEHDDKPYNREAAARLLIKLNVNERSDGSMPLPEANRPETSLHGTHMPSNSEASPLIATPTNHDALDALNRFFEAICNQPRHLSDLLRVAGVSEDTITTIRREHLNAYITVLTAQLREWLVASLRPRHGDIVIRRFGLDGQAPHTLVILGVEYGLSPERIRQLEVRALRRLRGLVRHGALELLAVNAARLIIGDTMPLPSGVGEPAPLSKTTHLPTRQRKTVRPAGASALLTLELFEAALTIEQIAAQRGLAESTIYTHLAAQIRTGRLEVTRVLSPDLIAFICQAMISDSPPTSLAEWKQRLPPTITYGHLNCVAAAFPDLLPLRARRDSDGDAYLPEASTKNSS